MEELLIENKRLFFDFQKMTQWAIEKRRALLKLNLSINFILFIIGIIGAVAFAYYLFLQFRNDFAALPAALFLKNSWTITNSYLRIFFISILFDLYLIYRLLRYEEQNMLVLRKGYKQTESNKNAKPKTININDAFIESALQIIEDAYILAMRNRYKEVTALHIMTLLLREAESKIILWRLGANIGALAGKIQRGLQTVLYQEQKTLSYKQSSLFFTKEAKSIIFQAYQEVWSRGGGRKVHSYDLWIPIAETPGYAKEILYDLDIHPNQIRNVVLWLELEKELVSRTKQKMHGSFQSKYGMNRSMTAVETRLLNQFSTDLTQAARAGAIALSLGHKKELEQIFTIFQSGSYGIILVGQSGVGKESLVEEMALRMAKDQVPDILIDKRLVSLSMASIVAGGAAGDSSQRLYQILYEAAHAGNVVLFIKDIHTIAEGQKHKEILGMDEIIAQALDSKRFFLIATTDYRHYTKEIEGSSLYNSLTKIDVLEPQEEEAVLMLEARVPFIESKHNVYFTYQALTEAVQLTNRLIHTEYQPEKALKILLETASYVAEKRGKRSIVAKKDVLRIMSEKVNMPLADIEQDERAKLMQLEEEIHKRYIDQEYAVSQVAAALKRARAELRDMRRPIANFLFVGPTGVGKTELAKQVAKIYFNSEKDMIRLDMSEFQDISSIERLLGGREEGLLTGAVLANPYSILLLDELEKAHPNVLNLFLQVMDDGRVTSYLGEVVDCTNLIIIATSNAGTKILLEKLSTGRDIADIKEEFIKKELLEYFKPEFLNRFDDVILFQPLLGEHIEKIAGLILSDIAKRLELKGITLKVTQEAQYELAKMGFDPLYGARPLRRVIQDHVQNTLANFLITGTIGRRDIVYLESGGNIRIEKAPVL